MYLQDQSQVKSHNGNPYTSDYNGGIPPSPASSAAGPAAGMLHAALTTRAETRTRVNLVLFRTGKYQLDGGTVHPARPPTALSGTPPFVSQDSPVPVDSPSNNAAQNSLVKSSRPPTPSVKDPHGVLPAAGTNASSVVPVNQATLATTGTRASSALPLGRGLSLAKRTRDSSAVPLSRGINSTTGYALQTPPPSTMAREPAFRVLPSSTRRAAIRLR